MRLSRLLRPPRLRNSNPNPAIKPLTLLLRHHGSRSGGDGLFGRTNRHGLRGRDGIGPGLNFARDPGAGRDGGRTVCCYGICFPINRSRPAMDGLSRRLAALYVVFDLGVRDMSLKASSILALTYQPTQHS